MRLVNFATADGLRLDGLYEPASAGQPTVIHVHGKCGNFYQNDFIQSMFDVYGAAGLGFLSFNHRAHDCVAEGYRDGEVDYVGGSLEVFSECIVDINAAVDFVRRDGMAKVALQGHSNGAEKALYYWGMGQRDLDALILLSISDSYEMQRRWLGDESPEHQLGRLVKSDTSKDVLILQLNEYGIRTGDKRYHIPVTTDSLAGVLDRSVLDIMRIGHGKPSAYSRGNVDILVCIGERDPYLTVGPEEMVGQVGLRTGSKPELLLIDNADHHFHGYETQLVSRIIRWLRAREVAFGREVL